MANEAIFDRGPPPECPDEFNLARYVLAHASQSPDKTALEILTAPGQVSESWTFSQLRSKVLATASGLAELGLSQGDKLVLRLGHRSDFPILFLAANALGAIPVPTSPQLTTGEFKRILNDLGDVFAVVSEDDMLATTVLQLTLADITPGPHPCDFAQTHKDDPGYIIYTSGSSGQAKGVVHAQRAVWARRMMWDGWYDLTQSDRMLHAGAFNWTFTLGTGLLDPWAGGATALVYAGPPDRHIWSELAHAHAATLFAGAPGVFRQLLTSKRNLSADFSTLRHGLCAGEALSPAIRLDWEYRTGTDLHEALGMSEISTFISGRPGETLPSGAMGRPQQGRKVAVWADGSPTPWGETGILGVHKTDPGLMLGYHANGSPPALPLEDEWFLTGDLVSITSDGAVTYHGRSDALITAGGFRISPEEVEAALTSHEHIQEAAVLSVEIKEGTHVIAALCVGSVDEHELGTYMGERLASYKRPRLYRWVDALPRGSNGKLQRSQLQQMWDTQ